MSLVPLWRMPSPVSYNGFVFNQSLSSKVTARPIPTGDGRKTKHVEYTIECSCYMADATTVEGDSVDASMEAARRQLSVRGGELRFTAVGFGELTVNARDGKVRDVEYGPVPQLLRWTPLGGGGAAFVEWSCVTRVPECEDAVYEGSGAISEWTYDVRWDVDRHGYSVRTINGSFEIPATILAGAAPKADAPDLPPRQADLDWVKVYEVHAGIVGFTREHSHTLSEDRRRLRYTITDREESEHAFVKNCTDWEGSFDIATSLTLGFKTWQCGLSASYRVKKGQTKTVAAEHFLFMASKQLEWIKSKFLLKPDEGQLILQESFSARNSKHNDGINFSAGFRVIVGNRQAEAMELLGLFIGHGGTPQDGYRPGPRGNPALAFEFGGDTEVETVLTLCKPTAVSPGREKKAPLAVLRPGGVGGVNPFTDSLGPDPGASWIDYEISIVYHGENGVVVHYPLAPTSPAQPVRAEYGGYRGLEGYAGGPGDANALVQRRAGGRHTVRLVGLAMRAHYPIDIPHLEKFGGVKTVLVDERFESKLMRRTPAGTPIYGAWWNVLYALPERPTRPGLPPPGPVHAQRRPGLAALARPSQFPRS